MAKFDLNIGADVKCEGETCGKLHKVVIDPDTEEVTDVIVERGFLKKTDLVVPLSAIKGTEEDTVLLSVDTNSLEECTEYREQDFQKPVSGWGTKREYEAEHIRFYPGKYQVITTDPAVPTVHREVEQGVQVDKAVIERGTPVLNPQGELGKVDHLLIDPESGDVRQLVIRRGLIPEYRVLPMSEVRNITEESVSVDLSEDEVDDLPEYKAYEDKDIFSRLEKRLSEASVELSAVKASVEEGIARLEGRVENVAAKRKAEAITRSTEGILDVENELDTDTAVVARVTKALLENPRTDLADIEVISEGDVIRLRGKVDTEEIRQAAEEIAKRQEGVVSVINELQIEADEDTNSIQPYIVPSRRVDGGQY